MLESTNNYKVYIEGLGPKIVTAHNKDHARQVAIAKWSHIVSDTSKYSTMLKSLVA